MCLAEIFPPVMARLVYAGSLNRVFKAKNDRRLTEGRPVMENTCLRLVRTDVEAYVHSSKVHNYALYHDAVIV